eukprot:1285488-Rhodomonas_salina.1
MRVRVFGFGVDTVTLNSRVTCTPGADLLLWCDLVRDHVGHVAFRPHHVGLDPVQRGPRGSVCCI